MRTAFAAAQVAIGVSMVSTVNRVIDGKAQCIPVDDTAWAAWTGLGMAAVMFGTAACLLWHGRRK